MKFEKFISTPTDDVFSGAGSKGLFNINKEQFDKCQITKKVSDLKKKQKICTDRNEWDSIQKKIDDLLTKLEIKLNK